MGDAARHGLSEGAVAEGGGVVGVAGEEQFDEDGGHGGAARGPVVLAGGEAGDFGVVAAVFESFAGEGEGWGEDVDGAADPAELSPAGVVFGAEAVGGVAGGVQFGEDASEDEFAEAPVLAGVQGAGVVPGFDAVDGGVGMTVGVDGDVDVGADGAGELGAGFAVGAGGGEVGGAGAEDFRGEQGGAVVAAGEDDVVAVGEKDGFDAEGEVEVGAEFGDAVGGGAAIDAAVAGVDDDGELARGGGFDAGGFEGVGELLGAEFGVGGAGRLGRYLDGGFWWWVGSRVRRLLEGSRWGRWGCGLGRGWWFVGLRGLGWSCDGVAATGGEDEGGEGDDEAGEGPAVLR